MALKFGTPEYEKVYRNGFKSEANRLEAEQHVRDLFEHIRKQHPHLNNREAQWAKWTRMADKANALLFKRLL